MGQTNGTNGTAKDAEAIRDALAVDKAGETAKANGGGDVAVYDARRKELEAIRAKGLLLATYDRDSTIGRAQIVGPQSKTGVTMIENAHRDYADRTAELREAFSENLAKWAFANGHVARVPANEAQLFASAEYARIVRAVRKLQEVSVALGLDTLDSGDGMVATVAALVAQFGTVNPITVAAIAKTAETAEVAA